MSEYTQPSLQDKVVDDLPTILSLLDEYYQENNAPLIDSGYDSTDAMSWWYLGMLQHVFELDDISDASEAIHSSFHFALNLAGLANWQYRDDPRFYRDYLQSIANQCGDDKDALTARIITDTQAYMAKNAALARVVATYSVHVSPTPALMNLSSTVAALTLMQIDQKITSQGDEAAIERFKAEIEAWDGVIDE